MEAAQVLTPQPYFLGTVVIGATSRKTVLGVIYAFLLSLTSPS